MPNVAELPPHIEEIIERHKGLTEKDWIALERAVKSLEAAKYRAAKLIELADLLANSRLTPG
mgnify:CR=1 FL=1